MCKNSKIPRVSIIMNCYNGSKYLKDAIDSVYSQTYKDWEIIFWDNASKDNSREIALKYDSKLRYYYSEVNEVLGKARNYAIKHAQGEYIAFLDTDDIWLPEKLEIQVELMDKGGFDLGYAGIQNIDNRGVKINDYVPKYKSGNIFRNLLKQFDINVPTAIIRRSILISEGLSFDEKIVASEEYCLFMQIAINSKILVLQKILAKYRIHSNALTTKSIHRWGIEREYTLDLIKSRYPEIEYLYKKEFKEAYARANYYRARYYMSQGKKSHAKIEIKKNIFINVKYFSLWIISNFPITVWNKIHSMKNKR